MKSGIIAPLKTNSALRNITMHYGYNHSSNFARRFKAMFGISPLALRKKTNIIQKNIKQSAAGIHNEDQTLVQRILRSLDSCQDT